MLYTIFMLDEYKRLVKKLISFKTVSADSKSLSECVKTVNFFSEFLKEAGFKTQVFEGFGNPIFFAEYIVDPKFETCLIYGHYDVQPASLEDGWDTEPFKLTEKNEKLYGRGIMDDKGQFFVHMLTIANMAKQKKLKYNIKFISEGNEEVGSGFIDKFIAEHKDLLSSDFIMVSDGELVANKPVIELGYRGVINAMLTLTTSSNDLHSGNYGGASPSAAKEAARLISKLQNEDNEITIPEFYSDVLDIDNSIASKIDIKEYQKNTGTKALTTEKGYDLYTQVGQRPSLEITGVQSGYVGEGYRNSIPGKAVIKFNFRLVKNQTPEKVIELFKKFLKENLSDYVDYVFDAEASNNPVRIDANNKYVLKAEKILSEIFKSEVGHRYVGGSEPVVIYFADILGVPQVLVPFANEDGMMHGMNENFALANIEKQMQFSEKYFSEQ